MEMADVSLFERLKSWGWIVMVVAVIAFLVVLGLAFVVPAITIALVGLAVAFVGGFVIQIYGSLRIWLSKRSS